MLITSSDYDPEFGKGNDMFKDMALSRDLMEEYLSNVAGANDKVSLTVLKFSSWPFAKYDGSVNLPTEVDGVKRAGGALLLMIDYVDDRSLKHWRPSQRGTKPSTKRTSSIGTTVSER